ncbi:MAG: histidine ammonia-lyase, partial [Thermoleophilia bacterium]|nr:histidine ammonia-lyase [Thermoleophilia bacterium]
MSEGPRPELLVPGTVPLAQLERIYRTGAAAVLSPAARPAVEAAAARNAEAAAGDAAVYGVNT